MKCAIVLATYNRSELFKRTLKCVKEANYEGFNDIKLIISIDKADNQEEMKKIAENFVWEYGEKIIIAQKDRKGLRKHFIFCGSLSQKYGPVIFLEDDVVVNKNYYQTAQQMTDKYIDDDRIVGASLYTMAFNETAQRPFQPIADGSDVFFCSLMSWAPVYFPRQWQHFLTWLDHMDGNEIVYKDIPQDVAKWPKSSFKKLHIQYVQQNHLYFAYTRHSCATNFSEPGEHYKKDTNKLQVLMDIRPRKPLNLISLDDSFAIYDAFLELSPEVLKKLVTGFTEYNFEVDLYGKKEKENIKGEYIITTHKVKKAIKTWGRKMIPHEMNIINNIQGNEIRLCRKEDVVYGSKGFSNYMSDVLYDIKGSSVLKVLIADGMWTISFAKSRLKK